MDKPHNELLSAALARVAAELPAAPEGAARNALWARAQRALDLAKADDPDVGDSDAALAVAEQSAGYLAELVAGWDSGEVQLPVSDRAIFKRAMKAFRKRLKLTRLDDESTLGGSAMTGGRESSIVAVRPPEQYPAEVWQALAKHGRLREVRGGLFEAPD